MPQRAHGTPRPHLRPAAVALLALFALFISAIPGRAASHHGGTIMVTWQASLTTVDPAYTYSVADWPQTHALFDGLLGFDQGTKLVPELAASMPTVSNSGKIYTFHLRHGLVFSNGDPLTASDVVFSWERELAPKTASPLTYLWYALQGQAAYTAGRAKHVSGLKVIDPYTLRVTLNQPYPGFLYVLAIPSGLVVDPRIIHQYHVENKDMGTHVVGSGPYMLKDWVQGQKLDLVRNPHYFRAGLPFADAVHEDLGVNASVGLLRLEKGQNDLIGDGIPAAQFASVVTNSALSSQIAHRTDIGVYMIAMNLRVKPFNNLLVRRAVSYAISKTRAIRFINGRGVPAHGIIPSAMPGFGGDIPDAYPINLGKAKALLAKAGYPHGFSTTMGVPSSVFESRMADAAIYDLKQVGINVTIKPLISEGTAVATLPMQAYHWLMDYPDPADFVDGFTSCASAVPGGSNVGFYCNHSVDSMANAARGMSNGPKRVAAYRAIDEKIMADAPTVPVFYDVLYFIHSKRLGNFSVHPIWEPFDLANYWVR